MTKKYTPEELDFSVRICDMFRDVKDPEEQRKLRKKEAKRRYNIQHAAELAQKRKEKRSTPESKAKVREQNAKFRAEHPDYKKEYYQSHKEEAREWYLNRTPEQKEKHRITSYKRKQEYAKDPIYVLKGLIVVGVRRCLKGSKSKDIFTALDFTIEELKEHLEKQFEPWMNWDNLGVMTKTEKTTWQIDHIRPLKAFNIKELGDEEFKKCWALDNLRPLDARDNRLRPYNDYKFDEGK